MSKEIFLNNALGSLAVEYVNNAPFVHATIDAWSPRLFKSYLKVWKGFLAIMAERGHPCVFVAIPEGDDKLLKFEQMFGFEEVQRDAGQILLVKDTE